MAAFFSPGAALSPSEFPLPQVPEPPMAVLRSEELGQGRWLPLRVPGLQLDAHRWPGTPALRLSASVPT